MSDFTNESKSSEPTITPETKNLVVITNEQESGTPSRFGKARFGKERFNRGSAGQNTKWTNETKH